ncbi:MAG: hypothetical protein ACLUGO_08120 [Mediterraneibacter faecis]
MMKGHVFFDEKFSTQKLLPYLEEAFQKKGTCGMNAGKIFIWRIWMKMEIVCQKVMMPVIIQ